MCAWRIISGSKKIKDKRQKAKDKSFHLGFLH
jgi:hypothetical protein